MTLSIYIPTKNAPEFLNVSSHHGQHLLSLCTIKDMLTNVYTTLICAVQELSHTGHFMSVCVGEMPIQVFTQVLIR